MLILKKSSIDFITTIQDIRKFFNHKLNNLTLVKNFNKLILRNSFCNHLINVFHGIKTVYVINQPNIKGKL